MSKEEAHNYLYRAWENGNIPSNFTEDHSDYSMVVNQMVKNNSYDLEWYFPDIAPF